MKSNGRIAVYTALYGSRQRKLFEPLNDIVPHSVDLVCFTDDPTIAPTTTKWRAGVQRGRFADSRMSATWFRMNADYLFPDHDLTVWIDASFAPDLQAIETTARQLFEQPSPSPVACFVHPEYSTIWEEAIATCNMPKYNGEPCAAQAAAYMNTGFPLAHALYAGGIIVRNRDPKLAEFNRLWLQECVTWSCENQISLPYVLWRTGITPMIIPGNIYQTQLGVHTWTGPSDTP